MKITRINKIQTMLEKEHSLSINHLCDVFQVSKNTIRRDIADLEKRGVVKKVYGGITLKEISTSSPEPFNLRESKHFAEKKKVARIAASFVNDDDIIYIDSGTTTMHMLPYLVNKKNITIITASINVINSAIAYEGTKKFDLITTGGSLYYPSLAFIGPSVQKCLNNYNITKMFLASTGISIENGATNASISENEIKKNLMKKMGQKFLLIDSSKLDISSLITFCPLDAFDYILLDTQPPQKYVQYCHEHHVNLLTDDVQPASE
ncbi:MAG: DeoR/GlpR family DNA-binding transcription regulator [Megasphaera sp.]|jgi:DeoR family myo-inositol catabolism operon transcriptional repressor|nr:DeoR/GlpR family DNA-binding transcription regulator [Megasphaera sp.]